MAIYNQLYRTKTDRDSPLLTDYCGFPRWSWTKLNEIFVQRISDLSSKSIDTAPGTPWDKCLTCIIVISCIIAIRTNQRPRTIYRNRNDLFQPRRSFDAGELPTNKGRATDVPAAILNAVFML